MCQNVKSQNAWGAARGLPVCHRCLDGDRLIQVRFSGIMAEKVDRPDIFLLEKLFPHADQLFSFEIPSLESVGDEKADWWHRSNKQGALPRCELIDEFRRESGCAFYMSSFSEFLKLFNAPEGIVSTIREQEKTDNLTAVVGTSGKINVRLIESLNLLIDMAKKDPRNAIRRAWELLAMTIFGATNVKSESLHPDSEAMSIALKRLENSVEFSSTVASSIRELWGIARRIFNHSEWAYSPSEKDAEEFVLHSAAARRELGENVQ
jgi:hypothetical protein